MKIRNDIIKVYKDVHIWVGILSGLMLFVAFYAGAITMFEKPLQRWATPPSTLAPAPSLQDAPKLVAATIAAHPRAAEHYIVQVETTADAPARMLWRERGARRREFTEYASSFSADGSLQVERRPQAPVAQLVDTLHQKVGLPLPDTAAHMVMGSVALLYAVALLSGLIILLPTLTKDLFALRISKNIKRMWLDVHNALGLVSLPFHLVMALTSVVFAFHDQFYDAQDAVVYPQPIQWGDEAHPARPADARMLSPQQLLQRVHEQVPELKVDAFTFEREDGQPHVHVQGLDVRHGTRARTFVSAGIDPYSGEVEMSELPGHQDGWDTAVNTFFMAHFGSFGGNPVRWMYLLLGLGGAVLFYTGNLLWVESRRKKQRSADPVRQSLPARVLGCLTVGVSLGCVAGVSATIAATKWLPQHVQNVAAWHEGIYYAVFLAVVGWAFLRGSAQAACELLWLCAVLTLLIPLGGVAGALGIAGSWHHGGAGWAVDATALLAVPVFVLIARHSRRRALGGHTDSVWSAQGLASAPSPAR